MQNLYNKPQKIRLNNIEVSLMTLLITVLSYLFYLFIFPLNSSTDVSNSSVFFMSWAGILIALYIYLSWYKLTGVIFSLYTIFMLFFFLFNFGQPIMWAFGIHTSYEIGNIPIYTGFGVPTNGDIINGQLITCISALMFHLGAVICYKPRKSKIKLSIENDSTVINSVAFRSIFITSVIIAIVAIPVTLYDSFNLLRISQQYGYNALYYSEFARSNVDFSIMANMFFFPALVGLLIGSHYNKKIVWLVYITFTIYLLLNLFAGDRGSWVYKLVLLIWLSHVCYKPINFKKMIKYFLLSFLGLYIIGAFVSLRKIGLGNITVNDFISSFSFENSPIVLVLFEMGGSMSVVMMLLMYGWDVWPYTNTYLLGIMGMVTNKVIYTLDMPFSLISSWFSQDYLGITWGAGFSIVAEAVLNYGPFLAPLIMVILGYILTSMIYIDKKMNYRNRPLFFFFAVSTLHTFLPVARGFFQLLLKDWFYGVVIYIIFIILIKMFLFRPTKNYKKFLEVR